MLEASPLILLLLPFCVPLHLPCFIPLPLLSHQTPLLRLSFSLHLHSSMAHPTPITHQNNNFLFSFCTNSSLHSLPARGLKTFQSRRPLPSISFSHSPTSSSSSSSSVTTGVSTAPVECAPPAPDFDFSREIARLRRLKSKLSDSNSLDEKFRVIDGDSRVRQFFKGRKKGFAKVLETLSLDSYQLFLLKCVVAAGQEHVLEAYSSFGGSESETTKSSLRSALYALVEVIEKWDENGGSEGLGNGIGASMKDEEIRALRTLLKTLIEVEQFYDCIGGIIGYQVMVLDLLTESQTEKDTISSSQHIRESLNCQYMELHRPAGIDLYENEEYALQAALWGVEGLPDLGEMYPLGGSADRLGLVDPDTGECLPAAMLPYCGRTLLEGLIRDLQGREFLYFKIYGKQCITPVAIMTSSAKKNHDRIHSLCERLGWFGRGRSNFQIFEQPLVPTIGAEDGKWLVAEPFTPVCKPGGHGVIWKLAHEKGIFRWFHESGRKGATVRQVSNVVASTDVTMLALAGIGLRSGKKLGFASCQRNSGATEGINVLIEKKNLDGNWSYGLSCIEYTEFDKFAAADRPHSFDGLQEDFPANTNILYVDISSAELVGSSNTETSLPGMVINVRKPIVYVDHYGIQHRVYGGRLESTMQNIADNFFNSYMSRCYKGVENELDAFIVFNERKRVTSSAKRKRRHADKSLHQSPEGALLDITRNTYDILSECHIKIPQVEGNDKYVDSGPPFLILLHPALGPLWQVIRKKFYGGSISKGSEMQIEVAEFLWRDVQLDGSMIIVAENVMGSSRRNDDGEPILHYGQRCGRCRLQNVKVLNKGINWNSNKNIYWKHDVQRFEVLKVMLHGNAEFEATDVIIQGNHVFDVPDGYKMKVTPGYPGLSVQLDCLEEHLMDSGSWFWNYRIDGINVQLELVEL